jgi:putative acetyltransferase
VSSQMLRHLIAEAERRGYPRVSLETGSMDYFEPARKLYASFGFRFCGPFGSYRDDPNSLFMTREIAPGLMG